MLQYKDRQLLHNSSLSITGDEVNRITLINTLLVIYENIHMLRYEGWYSDYTLGTQSMSHLLYVLYFSVLTNNGVTIMF